MGGAAGAWRRNLFGWLGAVLILAWGAGASPGEGLAPAPAGLGTK